MSRGRAPSAAVEERNERALDLWAAGHSAPQICVMLDGAISESNLWNVVRAARDVGDPRATGRRLRSASRWGMSQGQLESLSTEAHRRGLSPVELVGLILSTIVDDGLYDAVLDVEPPRRRRNGR